MKSSRKVGPCPVARRVFEMKIAAPSPQCFAGSVISACIETQFSGAGGSAFLHQRFAAWPSVLSPIADRLWSTRLRSSCVAAGVSSVEAASAAGIEHPASVSAARSVKAAIAGSRVMIRTLSGYVACADVSSMRTYALPTVEPAGRNMRRERVRHTNSSLDLLEPQNRFSSTTLNGRDRLRLDDYRYSKVDG